MHESPLAARLGGYRHLASIEKPPTVVVFNTSGLPGMLVVTSSVAGLFMPSVQRLIKRSAGNPARLHRRSLYVSTVSVAESAAQIDAKRLSAALLLSKSRHAVRLMFEKYAWAKQLIATACSDCSTKSLTW